MAIEVRLPNIGENIETGDVLSILVKEGDQIAAEQGILEIETDKATLEVPSPHAGRVTKILVSEGETVPVGAVLLTLELAVSAAESPAAGPAKKESDVSSAIEPVATHVMANAVAGQDVPGDGHSLAAASPAVRRLARELGVDLARVRPTGPQGRITAEDVQAFVRESTHRTAEPSPPAERAAAARGEAGTDDYGAVRREKMSRIRQTIARNMTQSYVTIPQLTNFDDADVSQLENVRQESKADYARSGIKLTALPFLIKAVASALKRHPLINASLDAEAQEFIYKEYINIGIAVETERGLVVPVLPNVDQMAIAQIARDLATLIDRVRSARFTLDDLRGGTFTISNLGAIGGTYSTPLINPPQVAILLAGRSRKVPVFVDDHIDPRLMLPLSLTYDHRVVDGAAAARFLNDVKNYLEAPARLLLAP